MAYLNLLASVREFDVLRLQADEASVIEPSLVLGVSHILAYWITIQPLGALLGRALDGGRPLNSVLWHPLRPPRYHPPADVAELFQVIGQAWDDCVAHNPVANEDWLALEVGRLLRVFGHATHSGEGVVSALEPPADFKRASRVRLPWSPRSGA